jgi:hypothetical protein
MKVHFIWIILGNQCDSHSEFPGQYDSEWILELGNVGFGSVFRGPEAMMRLCYLMGRDLIRTSLLMKFSSAMINIEAKREHRIDYMAFLHIDNTPPHLVHSKFGPIDIPRLPHPLDSPDIAPCDFWLFGSLKMKLEGIFFDTPAALFAEVEETPGDISITEWMKVFDERKDCLKGCIDAEGEYLENNEFDASFLFTTKHI